MRENRSFRKRLFYTYLLVGTLNVIIIFFFSFYIFRSSSSTLIERAESQMTSSRSMTSTKLMLYLEKLKLNLERLSEHLHSTGTLETPDPSVIGVWIVEGQKNRQVFGDFKESMSDKNIPLKQITAYKSDYLLILPVENKKYIWLFNHKGISDLFSQREGLGTSGEVYLVGKDFKIKSASRHIHDWSNTTVQNNSVSNAFAGADGVNTVKDYRNVEVVSAFSSFRFDQLEFAILSEIDLAEVLHPLKNILFLIYALSGLLLVINLFFSLRFTGDIWKQVLNQKEEIETLNSEKVKRDQENALQVLRVQENEREKISFSLHDSVGQYLTVLKWGLSKLKSSLTSQEALKEVEQLSDTCDDIIIEIREISHDLMPTLIKDFGFCLAIKDYVEKQSLIGPLKIKFTYSPELLEVKFKRDFEINIYRMVQEFFQNTIKHSRANFMEINLMYDVRHLILNYKDNGIGMPQDQALPHSIDYRTKLFGGFFERVNYDNGLQFKITFNTSDIYDA